MKKGRHKTVECRVVDFNDPLACEAHIRALVNKVKKLEKYLDWFHDLNNTLTSERDEHRREHLKYKRMYEGFDMPSPMEVSLSSISLKPKITKYTPLLQTETGKRVSRERWRDRLFVFMDERNN